MDEDLYRMAKSLAIAEDCSISTAVNKLLRRINENRNRFASDGQNHSHQNSQTGLPVVECKTVITDEDVYQTEEAESLRIGYHD
jgi:hypothetical protein